MNGVRNLLHYFFVLCFQINQYLEANLHLDFTEQNYSYGGDFILEMKDTLYVEIKFWLLMVYTREYTFNQLAGSKIAIEWTYSNKLTNC